MHVKQIKDAVSHGILAFPATAFKSGDTLDHEANAAHIAFLVGHEPAALVCGGGAGEIFSLDLSEQCALVELTVAHSRDVPVIAGIGQGTANAREGARNAEKAGADALLLFPPYLVQAEQEGLRDYIAGVCRSTALPVIAYSRDNGVVLPETAMRLADDHSNFLGIKDGVGDFEALLELKMRGGDRLALINGVPTAEILAVQCFAFGIESYSSAVFSFLPEVAKRFFDAVARRDVAESSRLLHEFYLPLTALRRRRRGYAVSIIKAGLQLMGQPAGHVRPPLTDLTQDDMAELERLIDVAQGQEPAYALSH